MLRPLAPRGALAVAVLLVGVGVADAPLSAASDPPIVRPSTPVAAAAPAPPLHLLSTTRKSPRLTELQFSTPYLKGPTGVRVLTPVGYDKEPRKQPAGAS